MFTRAQLFDLAQRFVGTEEVAGTVDNPQVMAMLKLDNRWPHYRNGLGSHDMGDLAANVRQAPTVAAPVVAYLAGLAPSGRRAMEGRLRVAAEMLGGRMETLPWHELSYAHMEALRSNLTARYSSPATGRDPATIAAPGPDGMRGQERKPGPGRRDYRARPCRIPGGRITRAFVWKWTRPPPYTDRWKPLLRDAPQPRGPV